MLLHDLDAVRLAESRLDPDGLSSTDVRQLTLLFTQYLHALGRKVKLRQRAVSTACVFFQRFFVERTFFEHDPLLIAPTALWMASKVEESEVKAKHIVREMNELGLAGNMYEASHLQAAEYVVLEVIVPFGLSVDHPHVPLARLLAEADLRTNIGVERSECFVLTATALVNDACRAPDLSLCYEPRLVALACAHVASLLEHVPFSKFLPARPTQAEHDAIEKIAASLLSVYEGLHAGGGNANGRSGSKVPGVGGHAATTGAAAYSNEALGIAYARLSDYWAGRAAETPQQEEQQAAASGALVAVA